MTLLDRVSREPVLGFGALGLGITAWAPALVDDDAKKAAVAGILLWLQRVFSRSTKSADEAVEAAKFVGAVEHQAVTAAARVIALEDGRRRPLVADRPPADMPAA